jgi:hypothetical protein
MRVFVVVVILPSADLLEGIAQGSRIKLSFKNRRALTSNIDY